MHSNLIPLYEFISDGSQWFFTREYIAKATDFLSYVRSPIAGQISAQDLLPEDDATRKLATAPPSGGTTHPDQSLDAGLTSDVAALALPAELVIHYGHKVSPRRSSSAYWGGASLIEGICQR